MNQVRLWVVLINYDDILVVLEFTNVNEILPVCGFYTVCKIWYMVFYIDNRVCVDLVLYDYSGILNVLTDLFTLHR